MNEPESSQKRNEDYERQRVETNKEIQLTIQSFIAQAVYTSIGTLFLAVLYAVSCFFFIPPKTSIRDCIKEIGTITPLFIIVSTIAVEGGVRIMEWALAKRARRKDEERQRDAKLRVEGENNVINALTNLAKASKGGITVEKAIEQYKAQNGNTDSGNTIR